jgi:molecular chaperone GrpE
MAEQQRGVPIKVTVKDKRVSAETPGSGDVSREAEVSEEVVAEVVEAAPDYLQDLKRLQAEFDNYRKRMMKEQASIGGRAKAGIVEDLLPVLDNFERAIAHGEGGTGVDLVFKELKATLERHGLTEIPAEGQPFDPQVHEAVDSVEEDGLDQPTCRTVYRRGYLIGDRVARPAMVLVARPPDRGQSIVDEVSTGDLLEQSSAEEGPPPLGDSN